MARVDAIVLGAGIVGTSIGLQLAKRGLAVALVDRRARRDLLRQCRRDRRQHPLPQAFPPTRWPCCGRARARRKPTITLTFLPRLCPGCSRSRRLDAAAADGDCARHAAAVCGRDRRARGAARRGWREPLSGKEGWLKFRRGERASACSRASSRSPRNSASLPRTDRTRRASSSPAWRRSSAMPCIGRAP